MQLVESLDTGKLEVVETDLGGLRYAKEPKFIKCADCGKRAPNPTS